MNAADNASHMPRRFFHVRRTKGERGTVERKKENQIFLFSPTPNETGFPQGSGGQAHLPPASFPSLS